MRRPTWIVSVFFFDLIDQANQAETAPPDTEVAIDSPFSADSLPKVSIGERRPEAAIPLLLQALRCYSVFEKDDWQKTLQGGFLASQQIEQVRRNGYEVLLWLANDLVRSQHDYQFKRPLTPTEAAQQAIIYLSKAETAYEATQALHALRARCHEALGNVALAEADKQLATQKMSTIAFDHFLRGQAAWDANQPNEGVGAFEAALRVEPTHYWSMVWLGYCLAASNSPDDRMSAVRVFTGCILKRPDHAHVFIYRAYSYKNLNLYEEAIADYTKAIELAPTRARAWNGRANVFFAQRRYREALADSSKAIELDPESWNAWCDRGSAYNSLGQDEKALSDYSQALELNPNCAPAWAGRGMAYNDLNQPKKALADLAKALELKPQSAYAWNGVGVAHVKLNRRAEALSDFNKAIDIDPKFWAAWFNRGDRYSALGQKDKALSDYTKAIELNPKYAPAWIDRATTYNDLNQPERALVDLVEALSLVPQSATAWYARGVAHEKLNQCEAAVADFSKAIEIRPKYWLAWRGRAGCHYKLLHYDEALTDYSKCIELDPKHSRSWYSRGLVHSKLKQPEQAIADYSMAIELNPRDASSCNNLAWQLTVCPMATLRDPQRALELAERAVELYPAQGLFWHTLGITRYRVEKFDAAITALTKAKELRGEDPMDGLVLTIAHWRLRQYDQAKTAYAGVAELMKVNHKVLENNTTYWEQLLPFKQEAEALLGPFLSSE